MPALDPEPAPVARPFPPGRKRIFRLGGYAPSRAPYRKQRACNLLPRRAVGLVMVEIGGAPGAIILADRMDAHGIVEESVIVRERARIEDGKILCFGALRGAPIEEEERVLSDHGFRKRSRKSKASPMPRTHRKLWIEAAPHRPCRHNVEHGNLFEPAGMIERQTIAHTA